MQERFFKTIQRLHNELKQTKAVDDKSRQYLKELKNDIERLLKQDDDASSKQNKDLIDKLKNTAEQIEASHPELTASINNVITILVNLGI